MSSILSCPAAATRSKTRTPPGVAAASSSVTAEPPVHVHGEFQLGAIGVADENQHRCGELVDGPVESLVSSWRRGRTRSRTALAADGRRRRRVGHPATVTPVLGAVIGTFSDSSTHPRDRGAGPAARALLSRSWGGLGLHDAELRRRIDFGMDVVAVRRTSTPAALDGVEMAGSLTEALARADHVVVAAAATDATRHLLDADAFDALRPGAHVVNVARGSLIDQHALLAALDSGRVARASLDVTRSRTASPRTPALHPPQRPSEPAHLVELARHRAPDDRDLRREPHPLASGPRPGRPRRPVDRLPRPSR